MFPHYRAVSDNTLMCVKCSSQTPACLCSTRPYAHVNVINTSTLQQPGSAEVKENSVQTRNTRLKKDIYQLGWKSSVLKTAWRPNQLEGADKTHKRGGDGNVTLSLTWTIQCSLSSVRWRGSHLFSHRQESIWALDIIRYSMCRQPFQDIQDPWLRISIW